MYKLKLGCSLGCFKTEVYEDKTYDIIPTFDDVREKLKQMAEFGFHSLELSPMAGWDYDEEQKYLPKIVELFDDIKKAGIVLNSIHLPFALYFWDFSSLNEERRKFSVQHAKDVIKMIEDSGNKPNYYVIHHGLRPKCDEDRYPMLDVLAEELNELCEFTSATICIENMTANGLLNQTSEALYLLKKVPKLMMVVDLNHMFIETPEDYLLKIGDRVKCLHVSDRDEVKERHFLPCDGIHDWNKIIGALEKIGYDGVFTYEIDFGGDKYSIKDVKDNFEKLFAEYNR